MTVTPFAASAAIAAALVLGVAATARAHCGSLDGPVVKAAQHALDTRDVNAVLIWVGPADEQDIRDAFEQTVAVRALNPSAKALADRYFFETVVRVHRAGEGAPYTGLKPAGLDLGAAIPAADRAITSGSPLALQELLTTAFQQGLRAHFEEVMATKDWNAGDVTAGRRFVKAYVEYIHYVERLHEAIGAAAHGHFSEPRPSVR
jgi:hypothetical protein